MRLLHVIASLGAERGGPIQVMKEMAPALAARGHAVTILTTDAGPPGARIAPSERALDLGPGVDILWSRVDLLRPPYPSLEHALTLLRRHSDFDLVHVHGLFNAPTTSAMAILRALKRPYILRSCGMLDHYSLTQHATRKRLWLAAIERANVANASHVQVSTPFEERAVLDAVPSAHTVVLPQGVAPLPAPAARPHPRPYVLFLSRVARKKGLRLLVDAVASIMDDRPAHGDPAPLDLVIAGPDEDGHRAEVERHIATLAARHPDLAGRVHFVGPVAGPTKSAWFANAACFALPSDDENFGVVVIEAAHANTPILVSDQVGLAPDVVAHGAGRSLPRTPEAWSAALREVLATPRAAFQPGLSRLAHRYAWPALAAELEDLYASVLAELRAARSK